MHNIATQKMNDTVSQSLAGSPTWSVVAFESAFNEFNINLRRRSIKEHRPFNLKTLACPPSHCTILYGIMLCLRDLRDSIITISTHTS